MNIVLTEGNNFKSYDFIKDSSFKIFAFDYLSYDFFKNLKVHIELADDILNKNERNLIYDHTVSKLYWYKQLYQNKIISEKEKDIFNFLDPLNFHQKLLVTLIQFCIIQKILCIEQPEKIYATENLSKILKCLTNTPVNILNNENMEVFDKYDIRLKFLNKNFSFKISFKNIHKIQKLYENLVCNIFDLWVDDKKPIVVLLEFDPKKFKKFLSNMNNREFNCVLINNRKSAIINLKSIFLLKKYNIKIFNNGKFFRDKKNSEFLSLKFFNESTVEKILESKELELIFSYNGVSYYSIIKSFLKKQLLSDIDFNTKFLIVSKNIFKNYKIQSILSQYESGITENIFLSKRNDTPSFLIRHGFSSYDDKIDDLRWKYDQYRILELNHDKILLWGDSDYNYYSKFFSQSNLIKIGSPRHDEFFSSTKINPKSKKQILIAASPIIEWTGQQTLGLELKYEKLLQSLINKLKDSNYDVVIKLHPGWGWKFNYTILKILKKINNQFVVYNSEPIQKLLQNSDLIININSEDNQPSTIILEALIMKKPVINISLNDDWINIPNSIPFVSISHNSNFIDIIEKFFFDKNYYNMYQSLIDNHLKNYLSNHQNSSKILADFLCKKNSI